MAPSILSAEGTLSGRVTMTTITSTSFPLRLRIGTPTPGRRRLKLFCPLGFGFRFRLRKVTATIREAPQPTGFTVLSLPGSVSFQDLCIATTTRFSGPFATFPAALASPAFRVSGLTCGVGANTVIIKNQYL
jgi:hypothetical protein